MISCNNSFIVLKKFIIIIKINEILHKDSTSYFVKKFLKNQIMILLSNIYN